MSEVLVFTERTHKSKRRWTETDSKEVPRKTTNLKTVKLEPGLNTAICPYEKCNGLITPDRIVGKRFVFSDKGHCTKCDRTVLIDFGGNRAGRNETKSRKLSAALKTQAKFFD